MVAGHRRQQAAPAFNNEAAAVLPAELWDPATETWTTVSSMQVPRVYHGTAILQPDGSVLVAGSGEGGGGINHQDAQVYAPLLPVPGGRGRTIVAAPTAARYSQSFFVETPDAARVAKVSLNPPALRHPCVRREHALPPPELHADGGRPQP